MFGDFELQESRRNANLSFDLEDDDRRLLREEVFLAVDDAKAEDSIVRDEARQGLMTKKL